MSPARLFLLLYPLTVGLVSALEITEILPQNEGGLQDADFSSPGWIEIHNETAAAVDTVGWHLTDDALVPGKWTFPARSIPANGYLLVFASGKNRAPATGELHTNFQLDPDGEYLALTRPDNSVAQALTVPKLRRNVSWAYAAAAPFTTAVVADGAVVRWKVPTDGSLANTWTAAAFADGSWASGATGLGFDSTPVVAKIDFKSGASLTAIPAPSGWTGFGFSTVPETGTGPTTATVTVGSFTVKLDAVGTGLTLAARNRQGSTSDILNNTASLNNMAEDFIFAATSNYVAGTPKGMDVTISGLTANSFYPVTIHGYDRASGAQRAALWTDPTGGASGTLTFNGSDGQLADDAAFLLRSVTITAKANATGQIILQGRAAATGHATSHNVFVNGISIGSPSYTPLITTNVGTALQGTSSSLFLRATFPLVHAEYYATARLRVRYDDGFTAYLNGNVIASRNAPATPVWNSAATADHSKAASQLFEEISIPLTPGVLVNGTNVLAIQGLTQGAADTDFLLTPVLDLLGTLPAGGVFFPTQTPAAANTTAYAGLVRDTNFTVDRQYFMGSITTAIACPTAGAEIRYTLDGSAPTATTGTVYSTPFTFTGTAILRAAAFVPSWIPSNPDTQSFLNVTSFMNQAPGPGGWPTLPGGSLGAQAPVGWPNTWGNNAQVNTNDGTRDGTIPANYAMDQRVVTATAPGYGIPEALQSIPTLSLALNPADFLGTNGIYQNPLSIGTAWERDCSAELIDPTLAEKGFHETCRIEVHGNSSRNPYRMQKHSLRLSWKGEAGASKLHYKFFPNSNFTDFNKLILRATFTDGWGLVSWNSTRYRPDDSLMMRDVWMRQTWEAMGNLSPNSRYVHVVINGLYWGVYDASEHIDDDYISGHQGGQPTDWEVVSDFVDPDPSATSPWKNMFAAAALDLSVQANYEAVLQWLDPVNFADYYLLHQYGEAEDWPQHNGTAWRNKLIAGSKYKWLTWDQEIALQETGATNGHNIDRISPGAPNTTTARTPGPLWNALRANKEWRLLVADRAHALMNNGGPLSTAKAQGRWLSLAGELDKAIVAESARWGDTATETPYGGDDLLTDLVLKKRSRPDVLGPPAISYALKDPYLRNPDWTGNVDYIANTWIPSLNTRSNTFATITRLKNLALPLWPATEPPDYAQHGGNVASGYALAVSSVTAGAAIYYTTNGTDPRQAVTGNAVGTLYTAAVPLTVTGIVKARAVTGTPGSGTEIWSALTEAEFIVGTAASAANLAISEIHYHPATATEMEFIELVNFSTGVIDLTNVHFTEGITYQFVDGTLLTAGQRIVVTGAQFTGKLDNNGEYLALLAANGDSIQRFRYNDSAPWPSDTDGQGYSLVNVHPGSDPTLTSNWRASTVLGGTPGTTDRVAFTGDPNADTDHDGLTDFLSYALGGPLNLAVTETPTDLTFVFLRSATADDAKLVPALSNDLSAWSHPATLVSRLRLPGGLMQDTWTCPVSAGTRLFYRLEASGF